MKTFERPADTWLCEAAFRALIDEHQRLWSSIEGDTALIQPLAYADLQNRAMLLQMFLEQAFGAGGPHNVTRRILERDFSSLNAFAALWQGEAVREGVDWVILALSFADFRFHLFPIGGTTPVPFCASPVLCACMREDVVHLSGLDRLVFAAAQWTHIRWEAVEQRIACLSLPLDVFGEFSDCVGDVCTPVELEIPYGGAAESNPATPSLI